MAAEDLGTLQIGLRADLSGLDSDLKIAEQKVRGFKIPEREIPIRVRISTPTEDAIKKAQQKIDQALTKAQKLGVELTPTLTVKNVKIGEFRNAVQSQLDKQDPVKVPVSADVDGRALRDQILGELGVVDIPLTWHWQGEPPPGGGPFSVGIVPPGGEGGGGVGPTAPPRPSTGGTGGTKATPRKQDTGPIAGVAATPAKSEPKRAKAREAAVVARPGAEVRSSDTYETEEPPTVAAAPVSAVGAKINPPKVRGAETRSSDTYEVQEEPPSPKPTVVAAPTPAAGGARINVPKVITRTPAGEAAPGATEEERVQNRVSQAVVQAQRGRFAGIQDLIKMGLNLGIGGTGDVSVKKKSVLAKHLEGKPPEVLDAIQAAVRLYRSNPEYDESRPAFTGRDLRLAGELPNPQSPQAVRRIREQIQTELRERQVEFRKRPDVKALRAALKEQGLDALLQNTTQNEDERQRFLGFSDIQELIKTNPVQAREETVKLLTGLFAQYPKIAPVLFPSKKRRIKTIEPTIRNEAGEEVPNPKYDPGIEATAAALHSIFGELSRVGLPIRDKQEKENRRQDLAARSERPQEAPPKGAAEAAAEKNAREQTAFDLTRKGLSRARVPEELAPKPIDFSAADAARDAEIEAIRRETVERFNPITKTTETVRPFASLELAAPEYQRRYPSSPINTVNQDLQAELLRKRTPAPQPTVFPKIRYIPNSKFGGPPLGLTDLTKRASGGQVEGEGRRFHPGAMRLPTGLAPLTFRPAEKGLEKGKVRIGTDMTSPFWHHDAQTGADLELHDRITSPAARYDFELEMGLRHGRSIPWGDQDADAVVAREMKASDILPFSRRAAGGPVPGGLMDRIAKAKLKDPVLVGEVRPETYISHSGHVEIVGREGPEVRQFPEAGKILPNVPEWVRRMDKNAKDMTRRAPGGPVRGFGGKAFRSFVPGEKEAIEKGVLTAATSPNVQRVFVVNWPTTLGARSVAQAPTVATAAQPVTMPFAPGQAPPPPAPVQAQATPTKQTKTTRGTPTESLTPAERFTAELDLINRQTIRRFDIKTLEAQRSSTLATLPTRGIQTGLGEIAATTLGGRAGVIQRARIAQGATEAAAAVERKLTKEEGKLFDLTAKRDALLKANAPAKEIDRQNKKIALQAEGVKVIADRLGELKKTAAEYTSQIASGADKLRVFGTNTAGIIGGTVLFSAALGAAQVGITGIEHILAPTIERMGGFANVAAQVTDELSNQSQGAGGDSKSILALAEAQRGLSSGIAATISPLLEQRTSTEEGNKNLASAIDLLHTFEDARRRGGQQGLFSTTGGLFGTFLGGTASTQELIKNELNATDATLGQPQSQRRQKALAAQAAGQTTFEDIAITGGVRNIPVKRTFNVADVLSQTADEVDVLGDRLQFFNEAIKKGGENVQFLAHASKETSDAFASAADKAGVTELGTLARGANKVILVGPDGKTPILDEKKIRAAVEAVNVGAQTPDPALLLKQLQSRIIPAQNAAFEAEANLQLNTVLPAQRALNFLGAPPTAFGAGIVQVGQGTSGQQIPTENINLPNGAGVDPEAIRSFNEYKSVATASIDAVKAKAEQGKQALAQLGVPPTLIAELSGLGQQIESIQTGIANRNASLAAAQYNHQLFILNRNLQDALALAGKRASKEGELGKLQREQFELSKQQTALQRESQALSLNLTQRQINFQRAVAGFVAPGTTPEERAARIEEAKIEADYAQKQLDIQKKLFGLSGREFTISVKLFDESAKRQVQDLRYAIADLTTSHKVQLENAAALEAIDAIKAHEAEVSAEIGVAIDKSVKKASAAISTALDITTKTGEAFNDILRQTATAWGTFVSQGVSVANALAGAGPAGGGRSRSIPNASGAYFNTTKKLNLTVGEAGTETVAILRNPRSLTVPVPTASGGGFGAPPQITIIVTGNKISDQADEAALAQRISDKVEETFMRKTSLFGLRRA